MLDNILGQQYPTTEVRMFYHPCNEKSTTLLPYRYRVYNYEDPEISIKTMYRQACMCNICTYMQANKYISNSLNNISTTYAWVYIHNVCMVW